MQKDKENKDDNLKSDEEKFVELSKKSNIEYFNKYESCINCAFTILTTIINTVSIAYMTSFGLIISSLQSSEMFKDIFCKISWKILTVRQWMIKIKDKFSFSNTINITLPNEPINNFSNYLKDIYNDEKKKYVEHLETENKS